MNVSQLSAAGSTDPDGNALKFHWLYYPEPGTFTVSNSRPVPLVPIEGENQQDASFVVPEKFFKAGTMHFIVAVTDDGAPPLTRYRRVIVNVRP